MARYFPLKAAAALGLLLALAGCGQNDGAALSTESQSGSLSALQNDIPDLHRPRPRPRPHPTQSWTCTIIGKDGDVFGNFTGTGTTQAAATANGMAACQAVGVYASCFVNSCSA